MDRFVFCFSIEVCPLCRLLAAKSNVAELDIVNDYLNGKSNVHAASLAKYKDDLFNKKVSIFIAVGDEDCFVRENVSDGNNMQLAIVDDLLDCVVSANDDNYILNGVNKNGSMNVIMIGEDFTENQFVAFVNNISSDSSLLVYPQLRKTLLVLPEKRDFPERDFLYFTLSKIGESYAKERNYSDWSVPIVGHWNAHSSFYQDEEMFSVSFFDLDYDYNAKQIHKMFMNEKRNNYIDKKNHPSDVANADSWYLDNYLSNELSFSTKSYIIAIDSYGDNRFKEEDLVDISKDLQIWE